MKIFPRNETGLTAVEILVIIAILAILAGLLLPALTKPQRRAQKVTCVHNLKQIGISFRLWSYDHDSKQFPLAVSTNQGGMLEFAERGEIVPIFESLGNELGTPTLLICPNDSKRKASTNFASIKTLNISYFVGIDAAETNTPTALSGDRNITNGLKSSGLLELTTNQMVGFTKEIHNDAGNILLADGSVHQVSSARLRSEIIANTGFATNRILLP